MLYWVQHGDELQLLTRNRQLSMTAICHAAAKLALHYND